jgi:hypothetical protein
MDVTALVAKVVGPVLILRALSIVVRPRVSPPC